MKSTDNNMTIKDDDGDCGDVQLFKKKQNVLKDTDISSSTGDIAEKRVRKLSYSNIKENVGHDNKAFAEDSESPECNHNKLNTPDDTVFLSLPVPHVEHRVSFSEVSQDSNYESWNTDAGSVETIHNGILLRKLSNQSFDSAAARNTNHNSLADSIKHFRTTKKSQKEEKEAHLWHVLWKFLSILTGGYAFFMCVVAIAFQFLHNFDEYQQFGNGFKRFKLYLYTVSLVSLITLLGLARAGKLTQNDHYKERRKDSFIRGGMLVLGSASVIYYALLTQVITDQLVKHGLTVASCHGSLDIYEGLLGLLYKALEIIFLYIFTKVRINWNYGIAILGRIIFMQLIATNLVIWIDVVYAEYLHEKAFAVEQVHDIAIVPASNGTCTFPFTYYHQSYSECTTIDNEGELWCSLTSHFDEDKKWKNCDEDCVFPFVHNGNNYDTCITIDNHDVYWCSLTSSYDEDHQRRSCDNSKYGGNVNSNHTEDHPSSPDNIHHRRRKRSSEASCHSTPLYSLQAYLFPLVIEYSILVAALFLKLWEKCDNEESTRSSKQQQNSNVHYNPAEEKVTGLKAALNNRNSRKGSAVAETNLYKLMQKEHENNEFMCKEYELVFGYKNSGVGFILGWICILSSISITLVFMYYKLGSVSAYNHRVLVNVLFNPAGYGSQIFMSTLLLIAVPLGVWRLSELSSSNENIKKTKQWKSEVLAQGTDKNLIYVTATALMIWKILCLAAAWEEGSILLGFEGIISLGSVIGQTLFITMYAIGKHVDKYWQRQRKPGRQVLEFVRCCNFSLWIINTFMLKDINTKHIQYTVFGPWGWSVISNLFQPLAILHYFHVMISLADIAAGIYNEEHIEKSKLSKRRPTSSVGQEGGKQLRVDERCDSITV